MEVSDSHTKSWSHLANVVFKEMVLSRFLLHVTETQIFWQCTHSTALEDGIAKYLYSGKDGWDESHYEERALGLD